MNEEEGEEEGKEEEGKEEEGDEQMNKLVAEGRYVGGGLMGGVMGSWEDG